MESIKKVILSRNFIFTAVIYIILLLFSNFGLINFYWQGILKLALINIILVISLNIATGFIGQVTLAHSGFMAIGAYLSVVFTKYLTFWGIFKFPVALILAGIISGLIAFLVSIPAMKIAEDFLFIVTLGFNELIRNLIINLFGSNGIRGIPYYSNLSIIFFVVILIVFLSYSLKNSKYGRACICISQNEKLSRACGINSFYYKIAVFTFAAFFAGVAGGLYAHEVTIIMPDMFSYKYSLELIAMVVIGGFRNILGSIISAVALTILGYSNRFLFDNKFGLYMFMTILFVLYCPKGFMNLFEFLYNIYNKIKNKISKVLSDKDKYKNKNKNKEQGEEV